MLSHFIELDLIAWQGLPPKITLSKVNKEFPDLSEEAGVGFLGSKPIQAHFKVLPSSNFSPPLQIWYLNDQVLKIEGSHPQIKNLDLEQLLQNLGEPEAKLDFNYDIGFIEKGEWVYPKRGLSLCRLESGKVVKLIGFHPMSLEQYNSEIRYDEPIREFLEPDGDY